MKDVETEMEKNQDFYPAFKYNWIIMLISLGQKMNEIYFLFHGLLLALYQPSGIGESHWSYWGKFTGLRPNEDISVFIHSLFCIWDMIKFLWVQGILGCIMIQSSH
jgi:hypothetical protein